MTLYYQCLSEYNKPWAITQAFAHYNISKEAGMPGNIFNDSERRLLIGFPQEVCEEDLMTYFTFSNRDWKLICQRRGIHNRAGFALQLGFIRFLGFVPNDFSNISSEVISFIAKQFKIDLSEKFFNEYGGRGQTCQSHFMEAAEYLGFRKSGSKDLISLSDWLVERALEHDKPSLLFSMACDRLYLEKILRPGVTILERMVMSARQKAHYVTYQRINKLLTDEQGAFLDALLVPEKENGRTPLFWLRQGATTNNPKAILDALAKLSFLREGRADQWNLDKVNPNRQKFLAQQGRKLTNQALQRMSPERRYPILVAFLRKSLEDITDELIDLYDRCISDSYSRAKRRRNEFQLSIANSANDKILLFKEVGLVLLDPEIPDDKVREVIYSLRSKKELESSVAECDLLIRPKDDKSYDYLADRYSYFREFTPQFLKEVRFHSIGGDSQLLEALELLVRLDSEKKRKIPPDAPMSFISKPWLPLVLDENGMISRRYYEMCALWELRNALRSGDIWVENSRKYADPETYLIPKAEWPNVRPQAGKMTGTPEDGRIRLRQRREELETILAELDRRVEEGSSVRIESGKLVARRLKADILPESAGKLQEAVSASLPRLDLPELLMEVDRWTGYSECFDHAGGGEPRSKDLLVHLYACLMAQACNFGLAKMADVSGLSYSKLIWCSNWYIREETLKESINTLVNFQYRQPLSKLWGGGTLSSSDGQRFPVPVKARNAVALPPYFGYGKGLTFMSWTSDQFSQYGSKVVPSTLRDALYVLDEIMDNETDLPILEHTTDTAGYTELIFALFDLLGLIFSPRIRDLGDQQIYRTNGFSKYKQLEPVIHGNINLDRILQNWDDMLRVAASIKLGWVTASMLVSKFQTHTRQNVLVKALQEYGRLIKSIFIPTYLCREDRQRRIHTQLNKGESLHDLRRFLFFADDGKIRKSQIEDQLNQAACLTLVTNAIIVWNTRYIKAIINRLRQQGNIVRDEDLAHVSPCRFGHINKYGKYNFDIEKEMSRMELRTLRMP